MTDLIVYTVAVLSAAGLAVLGLHRDQIRHLAGKDDLGVGPEAWLPPETWDRLVAARLHDRVDFEREYFGRWVTPDPPRARDGYRPTFVATDELAPYLDVHRETVAAFAAIAEVPTVFMDAAAAQLAECMASTSRWVAPAPSVFETHPTSPVLGDVAYGRVPEGCWKTVEASEGYGPCNAPVDPDDDLGLCQVHRAELRSAQ